MKLVFAGAIGGWELILIFAVILLLFGARKLPELARGLGQAIREFRKASREVADEITATPPDTGEPNSVQKKPGEAQKNS
ncbi:MAG: twin-arginine translocase TatA/TatE family subunit [Verrucomicrobiae bacterium]|nr:twin-arginine translocase TatA/TatE family subunit [Verrucomicrobiae bacterium]MCX7722295.1 twin-arginine translocase TatA/TatE family subunit [Verrucomicrobiae bacterium]MDW7980514.1 twin-arginine translocase TatA/TatE family subunit [Verrucomicrobiales bacterium]